MVGFPTTGGWRLLHSKTGGVDLYPATDAPVVARMRAAGAVILGKDQHSGLERDRQPRQRQLGGPHLQRGRPRVPARRIERWNGDGGRGELRGAWALPRRRAARSRTRPPRRGWSASSRPSRSCRTWACCRCRACATWSARLRRCVRDAALALDALAGFTMADPKTIAGIGRQASGRLRGQSQAGRAARQAHRHIWPGVAQPAALGGGDGALSRARSARSRRRAQFWSRIRSPARASPTDGRRPCRARNMTRAASNRCPTISANISSGSDPTRRSRPSPSSRPRPRPRIRSRRAGVLSYMPRLPAFNACLADPTKPPDMSAFIALREKHLAIFNEVFATASAGRRDLSADARAACRARGQGHHPRDDSQRDQHRRPARRHVACRVLRLGLAVQPDRGRPAMERSRTPRHHICLRTSHPPSKTAHAQPLVTLPGLEMVSAQRGSRPRSRYAVGRLTCRSRSPGSANRMAASRRPCRALRNAAARPEPRRRYNSSRGR